MTSQSEHSILISPVGDLSGELLEAVAGEIEQVFGFSTETSPILQDLSFALDDNRNQYHSTAILDRLAANIPPIPSCITAAMKKISTANPISFAATASLCWRMKLKDWKRFNQKLLNREP